MRKPLIAGNWKMNTDLVESKILASKIKTQVGSIADVDIVLCPPFIYLPTVAQVVESSTIAVGAQDLFWEESGAFTGEISPGMIRQVAKYVIIGHSERRTKFGETDEIVNKKVRAALKYNLIPIVCVGESLEAYRKGNDQFILEQVKKGLADVSPLDAHKIIIAYEPIWAIGTGNAATTDYANRIVLSIRQMFASIFSRDAAQKVRILYGGSVNQNNGPDFVAESEIDGLLVGGASLKSQEFCAIIRKVKTLG